MEQAYEAENTGCTGTNRQYTMGFFRGNCFAIAKVLQPGMLTRIRASQLGSVAYLCKARDVIYWPTLDSEVKDFISNCNACHDHSRLLLGLLGIRKHYQTAQQLSVLFDIAKEILDTF